MVTDVSNWHFEIQDTPDGLMIYINNDVDLDTDDLRSEDLPENIKKLLESVGVYTACELMECVFEINSSKSVSELTKELVKLGFENRD